MKAARLNQAGTPLQIEDIPDPRVRAGGVVVRVLSSHMMSYTGEVTAALAGRLTPSVLTFSDGSTLAVDSGRQAPPVPYTPGLSTIGIVEAVGENVYGLEAGQKVLCDPYYTAGANGQNAESILIGWMGISAGAGPLLDLWKNGSFAEKALYPAACVTPLGAAEAIDPVRLAVVSVLAVAYGALLNGGFHPGQRVVVGGATGSIGSSVVLLALALGASRVVAAGREAAVLQRLASLDPRRVRPVSLRGEASAYAREIAGASEEADLVIDAFGAVPNADPTLACLSALRIGGTGVIVGGVRADIPLPYANILRRELTIRGSYMYPHSALSALLQLIGSGVLSLEAFQVHPFPLSAINEAMTEAAGFRGLDCCVVVP